MRRFLLPILLVLAGPGRAETPGVPLEESVPHMTTTGEAGAEVMPDEAELRFAIVRERPTPAEAADAAAKDSAAMIAAAQAAGVASGDIRTRSRLTRTFDTKKDDKGVVLSRTPRGYEAEEHVAVRLHDVGRVGAIARDLVGGADTLEDIAFSYSKEKQKRRDLDAEAMRDALLQAKTLADAVGLKLGRVLRVGWDPINGGADLPSRATPPATAAAVAIPLEPGPLHLQEAVTVIWEIEGRAR